jgi:hypothetical protein
LFDGERLEEAEGYRPQAHRPRLPEVPPAGGDYRREEPDVIQASRVRARVNLTGELVWTEGEKKR